MFLCIGNTNRTTCPICVELVTAGSIKSITEMDLHHKMHKENPGFRETSVGLLPEKKLGSVENEETPDVTCIELVHGILHNIDVDPDNVLDSKHLQPSKWKSGKCRFRKLCEMIDREEDVKHVVRNGQLNYPQVQQIGRAHV